MIARPASVIVKIKTVAALLGREYGIPRREKVHDPLEELIFTLLSQNTNDRNRDRAWEALRAAYPTWNDVVAAGPGRVARAIRPGGLGRTKGRRIISILKGIKGRYGAYDIDFLGRLPRDEARRLLLSFTGVGPKTAACVLLFSCGLPAFPVDTHIHRVATRLGLLPTRTTREKAHGILEGLVPQDDYYPVHINMIRHGRTVCRAARPRCADCILLRLCPYGQTHIRG